MKYRKLISSLKESAIGIHPISPQNPYSKGKSFGKLLAYMAADCAVVTSNDVDHKLFYKNNISACLPNSESEWLDSLEKCLIDDNFRQKLVISARVDFEEKLTTEAAAANLTRILKSH